MPRSGRPASTSSEKDDVTLNALVAQENARYKGEGLASIGRLAFQFEKETLDSGKFALSEYPAY